MLFGGGGCTVPVVAAVLEENAGGMLGRWVGWDGATAATVGFSSGSKCDGLEITGLGTSLTGAGAGLLVDGPAAADPSGKSLSTSVSRMMVLTAYLTALFSALAMMAAAVPYVFNGGLWGMPDEALLDGVALAALSFS